MLYGNYSISQFKYSKPRSLQKYSVIPNTRIKELSLKIVKKKPHRMQIYNFIINVKTNLYSAIKPMQLTARGAIAIAIS